MQYALDNNGNKVYINDANKGEKYFCPCCNSLVIQKKGFVNAWHYSHKNCVDCDGMYLEDEWAKNWMASVNEKYREIAVFNPKFNAKKKANIKAGNVVLLLQNRSISSEEFQKRVNFFNDGGRHLVYLVDVRDKDVIYMSDNRKFLKFIWKHAWKFNEINIKEETFDLFLQIADDSIIKVTWNGDFGFKYFGGYNYSIKDFHDYFNRKYKQLNKKKK